MDKFFEYFTAAQIQIAQKQLSSDAQALYLQMMFWGNRQRWQPFPAWNDNLMSNAGLKTDEFFQARKELTEKGFIRYTRGGAKRPGTYEVINLAPTKEPAGNVAGDKGGLSFADGHHHKKRNFEEVVS